MKKEEWIEQLHDRMSNHEEAVPEGLWEKIESALPETERPRTRVLPLRRWAAAAALAAILLGGAGYWMRDGADSSPEVARKHTPTAVQAETVEKQNDAMLADDMESTEDEQTTPPAIKQKLIAALDNPVFAGETEERIVSERSFSDIEQTETTTESAANAAAMETEKTEHKNVAPDGKTDTQTTAQTGVNGMSRNKAMTSTATAVGMSNNSRARTSNGRWSAGLLAANVMQAGQPSQISTQPVAMSAAKAYNMGYSDVAYTAAMNSPERSMMRLPGYEEHAEHHMPVAFGVSVRYKLNERWAVESGLVYSRLTSDFTRRMQRNELTDHQTLHYVGLPLAVDYTVWSNKLLSAYLQAGGQVDKNVKARLESEGTTLSMDKDRLQWSAGSAVGVQVNVTPALSIYVEPGLRYYFDNKSNVESIFKDKKLNFQLQFGVRIDIK